MDIQKVVDPSKVVTDNEVLRILARQGIDHQYVEFWHDYAPKNDLSTGRPRKEYSPYTKHYRDLKSGKRIMVTSNLPKVKNDGTGIVAGWDSQLNEYTAKANMFDAAVDNKRVNLEAIYDQPWGGMSGDSVNWTPQLFFKGTELFPVATKAVLLPVDPVNSDYRENVLQWDYGVCKRILRIIEGRLLETWLFAINPKGEVRIKHNHSGKLQLRLGNYAINNDEELVPAQVFDEADFPFIINANQTFYPDAGVNSVDGYVERSVVGNWASVRDGAGDFSRDSKVNDGLIGLVSNVSNNWWRQQRGIFIFYTASLPNEANISAGTITIFGFAKVDDTATPWKQSVNIYSANPASNNALVNADYAIADFGTTPFSTPISYDNFEIGTPGNPNDFALNASGLAAIDPASVSKFGTLGVEYDVADTPPPHENSKTTRINVWMVEQGTTYRPKLVITYTLPAAAGGGPASLLLAQGVI